MAKLLEKAIKDAIDDGKISFGTKEALGGMKNSKLIVLSHSIPSETLYKVAEAAKSAKVQTLSYRGSSVELGRLCGAQFRISAVSLKSLSETNLKAIIKDAEQTKSE